MLNSIGSSGWASAATRERSRLPSLHKRRPRSRNHFRRYHRPRCFRHSRSRPLPRLILYNEQPWTSMQTRFLLIIVLLALTLLTVVTRGAALVYLLLFGAPLVVPALGVIAILRICGIVRPRPTHRPPEENGIQYWE